MNFEDYMKAAIAELEAVKAATKEHHEQCTVRFCTHCTMYTLIDPSIASINAALASEEQGTCDDPNCINNIAYAVASGVFNEIIRKPEEEPVAEGS